MPCTHETLEKPVNTDARRCVECGRLVDFVDCIEEITSRCGSPWTREAFECFDEIARERMSATG